MSSDAEDVISWLKNNAGLEKISAPLMHMPTANVRGRRALTSEVERSPERERASASVRAIMSVANALDPELEGYTIAHIDPRVDVKKVAKRLQSAQTINCKSGGSTMDARSQRQVRLSRARVGTVGFGLRGVSKRRIGEAAKQGTHCRSRHGDQSSMSSARPSRHTATALFVVPRSMPMIVPAKRASLEPRCRITPRIQRLPIFSARLCSLRACLREINWSHGKPFDAADSASSR